MHIRKSDVVEVLSGNERGKRGKVLRIVAEGQVLVEGVNFVWKHLRRSQQHPHGARIQKEAPLASDRLMVVCTACDKASKVARTRTDGGEAQRVCKKCKAPISNRT